MARYEFRYFDKTGRVTVVHHEVRSNAEAVELAGMLFGSVRAEVWQDGALIAEQLAPPEGSASPAQDPER